MKKVLLRMFMLVLLVSSLAPAVFAGDGGITEPREIAEGYQLVKTNTYFYGLDGTENEGQHYVYAYEFDQNGNVAKLEKTVFFPEEPGSGSYSSGPTEVHEYKYDANGNRTEEIPGDADAAVHGVSLYTYKDGMLIEGAYGYEENNERKIVVTEKYTYNASGNLTGVARSDGRSTVYTYDKNGDLVSEKTTYKVNVSEEISKEIKYTRKDGCLVATQYDNSGVLTDQTVYEYDSAGNNTVISRYLPWTDNKLHLAQKYVFTYERLGPQRDGWNQEDSAWYYYEDGKPVTGWYQVDGTWYYFSDSGVMQTDWLNDGGTWYYLKASGSMATDWVSVDGTWYYMNGFGAMQTGWLDNGAWYYLNSSGSMATGWTSVDDSWYYMNGSGAMQTGWLDDGAWYYLYDSGSMATGWVSVDGAWYYMSDSGDMQTGWLNVDGTWYYLYDSGSMATGWLNDGGTWYYLNESGAWVE